MRAAIVLALFNAVAISAYFLFETNPVFIVPVRELIIAIFVAFFASAILFRKFIGLQLAIASAVVTFWLFELTFVLAPALFPDNLRMVVGARPMKREATVDTLPYPPYAKPRPNVLVQIPGYYGPSDTFVYDWQSDRRGFKNLPAIAALAKVHAVAVGDSFTEGMGVLTKDTWASRLSNKGLPTYNLGIQGYAPIQFRGAYEHYGRDLSPKWVIYGLLGGAFERERRFLGSDEEITKNLANKVAGQAIDRLVAQDELNRKQDVIYLETKEGYRVAQDINQRYRFATTGMVGLLQTTNLFRARFDIKGGIRNPERDGRFMTDKDLRRIGDAPRLMSRYEIEAEIAPQWSLPPGALEKYETWHATLREIERVNEMAKRDNAKLLLVFFPNRGTVYHQRIFGRPLDPSQADLAQARALSVFAKEKDIAMVDITPVFQRIVDSLTDQSPIEDYPYLKVDGHPSPRGHEAIASAIEQVIKGP